MNATKGFDAAKAWERSGITEHLGGTNATRLLIERCRIQPGQRVLNIGCGTGYTACLLAKRYDVQVVAADINAGVLERATKRIAKDGLYERVTTARADIHALDFAAQAFDTVIAESVLVFCDKPRAAAEIYRVLKPGGFFGDNEMTYLKAPPPEWKSLFSSASFGIEFDPLIAEEWKSVFEEAGFGDVSGDVSTVNLREQFASHIQVDGWRKYLAAVARNLADPVVWATFFNRDMLRAWREYPAYVGYGLYVSRKP